MTAHATLQTAVAAIRAGAVDFLVKPLDPAELESALARVNVRRPEGQAHQAA
jgi:DNA-binding NtrC family response regulator